MTITYAQAIKMLTLVSIAVPDQLDCDGCFEMLSEFAERELRGEELSASLKLVEVHLTQCTCCRYEYETLIEAILAADELI
jgi:predicted anti-sigma-YlaC factor YlaD